MTILVGTVGQGVMRSADGGESWQRAGINQGMHSDAIVRCLSRTRRNQKWYLPVRTKGCSRAWTRARTGSLWTRR